MSSDTKKSNYFGHTTNYLISLRKEDDDRRIGEGET